MADDMHSSKEKEISVLLLNPYRKNLCIVQALIYNTLSLLEV